MWTPKLPLPLAAEPWRRAIVRSLATILVLIAIRVALPEILRQVILAQAPKYLAGDLDVGDVDLGLFRGFLAFDDVSVRSLQTATPDPLLPAVIGWKRLSVDLQWLALLGKTIRLREVTLDGPRIVLDREKEGSINLASLLLPEEPATETTPVPEPNDTPSTWGFVLDRFTLRTGGLRFHDLQIENSEPVELRFDAIDVRDIAMIPGIFGEPGEIHLHVALDDGWVNLDSKLRRLETGYDIESRLTARRLPLHRTRLYIPQIGWSELRGALDANLVHHFTADARNDVSGAASLRDVAIQVAGLDEPALSLDELTIQLDALDLFKQTVEVGNLLLRGMTLVAQPKEGNPLPLLASLVSDASPQAVPPTADTTTPQQSWQWAIRAASLTNSRVKLLTATSSEVGVEVSIHDVTSDTAKAASIDATLTHGAGWIRAEGTMGVLAPSFAGTVRIGELSIPDLLKATDSPAASSVRSARVSADLALQLAATDAAADSQPVPGALQVKGTLSVDDLEAAQGDGRSVAAKRLVIAVDNLVVPAILEKSSDTVTTGRIEVAGRIDLDTPRMADAEMNFDAVSVGLAINHFNIDDISPLKAPMQFSAFDADLALTMNGIQVATPGDEGVLVGLKALTLTLPEVRSGGTLSAPSTVRGKFHLEELTAASTTSKEFSTKTGSIVVDVSEWIGPAVGEVLGDGPHRVTMNAKGRITVENFDLAGEDPKQFSTSFKSLEIPLTEVRTEQWISPQSDAAVLPVPIVKLGNVRISSPSARVTRDTQGVVLIRRADRPTAATSIAIASAAPVPAHAPTTNPIPPRPPEVSPGPIELSIARFDLIDGSADVTDRAVKPYFKTRIKPLSIEAEKISWPVVQVSKFHLAARSSKDGTIDIIGAITPKGGWAEVNNEHFELPPINPYASTLAGYRIPRGALSTYTKISFADGRYHSTNWVQLEDFDMRALGPDSFAQQFGLSLSMALALLRDPHGNIGLWVPVEGNREGMDLGMGTIIAGALKSALIGALSSPLKLIGAGFGSEAKDAAPAPIAFRSGRAVVTPEGELQVHRLAELLASRPGLAATLATAATDTDVRWLREQSLRREWEEQSTLAALRDIGKRDLRKSVHTALTARAADEPAELTGEQQAALDEWLADRPNIAPPELETLAQQRLQAIRATLEASHGIAPERIELSPPSTEVAPGDPAVSFELGSATERPKAPSD